MTQHRDHHHDHHHPADDIDWEALADSLELDAAITMPIVEQVMHSPIVAGATHILDVGCGPGLVTVRMAQRSPTVRVTALDSSESLLARVRRRAAEAGVGDRVDRPRRVLLGGRPAVGRGVRARQSQAGRQPSIDAARESG